MFRIREATSDDLEALIDALVAAANWNGTARKSREEIAASKYVTGWPEAGDFGVVAEDDQQQPLGAAWCRLLSRDNAGYGFVADDVPELTIGMTANRRGEGIGTALLASLLTLADGQACRAVSLSVEDGNAARHLYERAGFEIVGRNGGSDTLLRLRNVP